MTEYLKDEKGVVNSLREGVTEFNVNPQTAYWRTPKSNSYVCSTSLGVRATTSYSSDLIGRSPETVLTENLLPLRRPGRLFEEED